MTLLDARIGYIIRRQRKHLKLTLNELGEMIGVDSSTLTQYEAGTRRVTNERAELLAMALGLDIRLIDRNEAQDSPAPKLRRESKVNVGPIHKGCVCRGQCVQGDVPEFLL